MVVLVLVVFLVVVFMVVVVLVVVLVVVMVVVTLKNCLINISHVSRQDILPNLHVYFCLHLS